MVKPPSDSVVDISSRSFDAGQYVARLLAATPYDELVNSVAPQLHSDLDDEDIKLRELVLNHLDVFVKCKDAIEAVYVADPDLFTGHAAKEVQRQYAALRASCEAVASPLFQKRATGQRYQRLADVLSHISAVTHVPSVLVGSTAARDYDAAVQALNRAIQFHRRQRLVLAGDSERADQSDTDSAQASASSGVMNRDPSSGSFASAASAKPRDTAPFVLRQHGFFAAWLTATLTSTAQAIDTAVSSACRALTDEHDTAAVAAPDLEEGLAASANLLRGLHTLYVSRLRMQRDQQRDEAIRKMSKAPRPTLRSTAEALGLPDAGEQRHPVQVFCRNFRQRLMQDYADIVKAACRGHVLTRVASATSTSAAMRRVYDPVDALDAELLEISQALLPALPDDAPAAQRSIAASVAGVMDEARSPSGADAGSRGARLHDIAVAVSRHCVSSVVDVVSRLSALIAANTFDCRPRPERDGSHRDADDEDEEAEDRHFLRLNPALVPPRCAYALRGSSLDGDLSDAARQWAADGKRIALYVLRAMMRADAEDVALAQRVAAVARVADPLGTSDGWIEPLRAPASDPLLTAALLRVQSVVGTSLTVARQRVTAQDVAPKVANAVIEAVSDFNDSLGAGAAVGIDAIGRLRLAGLATLPPTISARCQQLAETLGTSSSGGASCSRASEARIITEGAALVAVVPRLDADVPCTVVPTTVLAVANVIIGVLAPLMHGCRRTQDSLSACEAAAADALRSVLMFGIDVCLLRSHTPPGRESAVPLDALQRAVPQHTDTSSIASSSALDYASQLLNSAPRRVVVALADVVAIESVVTQAVEEALAACTFFGCSDPSDPRALTAPAVALLVGDFAARQRQVPREKAAAAYKQKQKQFRTALDGVRDVAALGVGRLNEHLVRGYAAQIGHLVLDGGFHRPGFHWQVCAQPTAVRPYMQRVLSLIVEAREAASVASGRGAAAIAQTLRALVEHAATCFTEGLLGLDGHDGSVAFRTAAVTLLRAEASAWRRVASRLKCDAATAVLEFRALPYISGVLGGGQLPKGAAPAADRVVDRLSAAFVQQMALLLDALDAPETTAQRAEILRREALLRRAARWGTDRPGTDDALYAAEAASAARREARKQRTVQTLQRVADGAESADRKRAQVAAGDADTAGATGRRRVKLSERARTRRTRPGAGGDDAAPASVGDAPSLPAATSGSASAAPARQPAAPGPGAGAAPAAAAPAVRRAPRFGRGSAAPTAAASDTPRVTRFGGRGRATAAPTATAIPQAASSAPAASAPATVNTLATSGAPAMTSTAPIARGEASSTATTRPAAATAPAKAPRPEPAESEVPPPPAGGSEAPQRTVRKFSQMKRTR